jgi:hypothetical protein
MKLLYPKLFCSLAVLLAVGTGRVNAQNLSENPLTGYTGFTESYDIPYSNNPGYGKKSPGESTVAIDILGNKLDIILDTGSRGLYVSDNLLPTTYIPTGITGNLYLSSSKRLFQGIWANLTIKFPAAKAKGGATLPAEATLPVLVVQTITAGADTDGASYATKPASGDIKLIDNTTVHFTGHAVTLLPGQVAAYADNIGKLETASNFGVAIDPSGSSTFPNNTDQYNQQYNAFLNLDQMKDGTMWAGYTLDQKGVHVGLTENTTGYAYTDLVPSGLAQVPGSPPDWQVPTGTIVYNGTTSGTGRVLLDVGIDYAFLILPDEPHSGNATANLTVNLLNSNGAVSYDINTTRGNLLNPAYIQWSDSEPGPFSESQPPYGDQFINTGRNVINGFDLVYDGTGGYFGLKTNSSVKSANIKFTAAYYPSPITKTLPVIVTQPMNQGAPVGANITFSVVATDTPDDPAYQWQTAQTSAGTWSNVADSGGFQGATTASLQVTTTSKMNNNQFRVVVIGSAGNVTSTAVSLAIGASPRILIQPLARTANPGQTVTFRIAANGSAPLVYAWQLSGTPLVNGGNVRGANTALLTLTRVTSANGGIYRAVVSNAIGTTMSNPVMLTVQGTK